MSKKEIIRTAMTMVGFETKISGNLINIVHLGKLVVGSIDLQEKSMVASPLFFRGVTRQRLRNALANIDPETLISIHLSEPK